MLLHGVQVILSLAPPMFFSTPLVSCTTVCHTLIHSVKQPLGVRSTPLNAEESPQSKHEHAQMKLSDKRKHNYRRLRQGNHLLRNESHNTSRQGFQKME